MLSQGLCTLPCHWQLLHADGAECGGSQDTVYDRGQLNTCKARCRPCTSGGSRMARNAKSAKAAACFIRPAAPLSDALPELCAWELATRLRAAWNLSSSQGRLSKRPGSRAAPMPSSSLLIICARQLLRRQSKAPSHMLQDDLCLSTHWSLKSHCPHTLMMFGNTLQSI